MTNPDSFYAVWAPRLLSVLRIITGFLFIPHGAQKLFGFMAPPQWSTPPIFSLVGIAGALEFFGGLLILLGLFTRPVAFILSGLMAVAYFMVHAPQGFLPLQNKGELAVIYSFLFLFLSVAGGGAWGIDRLWRGREAAGL
jgi:putative oxidoreductase